MNIQFDSPKKKVILEGCNGEWAQKSYLPFLVKKAADGEIELWAVDIEPQIKLTVPGIAALWEKAHREGKACYLDNSRDRETYERLSNANYVFVVAPDRVHSEIATFWLERLSPEGKIFIEKPLDASVEPARNLKRKIEDKGKNEAVFGFDHYLARASPLLQDSSHYLKQIGSINKIEFRLLEASGIDPKRAKTLNKGMVFDLFPHVLAVVFAVKEFKKVELREVRAARYAGCPISGETLAWIKFTIDSNIEVESTIGKCVGTSDDKFLRIYGAKGEIELNFVEDKFSVFDSQGKQQKQGKLNSKHFESFLNKVLQGKTCPLSVSGVLSFDAALEILKILDEAKRQIGNKMPEYRCNDPIGKILERLKERNYNDIS